jgi:hypothetical protein
MTTASPLTVQPATVGPAGPAGLDVPRVPFLDLFRVELRKAVDTRSGRWLLAGMAVATAAVVVAVLLTDDAASLTFSNLTLIAALPPSLLLPVLAILTATTEWSQRTGLVTYTLEPSRSRVTLAKLAAVVTIGLLAVALILGVAAVGNVAGAAFLDGSGSWDLSLGDGRDLAVLQLLPVLQGFAFGMLLMSTPAAIVAFFLVPLIWSLAFNLVGALRDAAPWVDLGTATGALLDTNDQRTDIWAHLAVAATIWVLLPLALGLLRLVRREIKSA